MLKKRLFGKADEWLQKLSNKSVFLPLPEALVSPSYPRSWAFAVPTCVFTVGFVRTSFCIFSCLSVPCLSLSSLNHLPGSTSLPGCAHVFVHACVCVCVGGGRGSQAAEALKSATWSSHTVSLLGRCVFIYTSPATWP